MKRVAIVFVLVISSLWAFGQEQRVWTLQECVDYALENNLDIRQSFLDVENADVNLRQAKYGLFPNLNARSSYQNNWGRSIDPFSNLPFTEEITFMNLSASTNVTIFNAGALRSQIKQNDHLFSASQYDLENSKTFITLSMINFYMNVIFNQELLENSKAQLNSTNRQLERTIKQVEAGALPISNQLELQAQQATNELNVINQENALNFSYLQLKQVLQLPASAPFEIVIPEVEVDQESIADLSVENVYGIALGNMPNIKAAEYRTTAADYGIQSAKGNLYPSVSLVSGISTNYSSIIKDILPFEDQLNENMSWFVGATLNIPIFNSYNSSLNLQRAYISKNRNEIILEQAKNQLRQDIESAYNDVVAAAKTFLSSQKQVTAREESFRVTEQRYNIGAADFVQYQVAENDLFGARSDLLRAKYDFIFKKKILDFYQGKTIEL